ncbi:hypothetical protein BJX68DRAFT_225993 [Aspergillus pseudodeflectus]|uniref:Zn(2)-C6 fungal-type domain-containing protein n=1 Tax=Aspergillus pseudodeflectus TaxID=176178 RepID=A0ABR4L6U1_9EURO
MASESRAARQSASTDAPFPRSRGATACEKCRLRKTKCDSRRPSCGYCLTRGITCVYSENSDDAVTGTEILQAIHRLTSLVESQKRQRNELPQQQLCISCGHHSTPPLATSPSLSSALSASQQEACPPWGPNNAPPCPVMRPQGVESILDWKIFASDRPAVCLFAQRNIPAGHTYPLPDMSFSQLARLESKFIDNIHTKNPIIDLNELHDMILDIAENGLDWSTRTCLVTLTCAIAAITESYPKIPDPMTESVICSTPSPGHEAEGGSELELAMQFWNLAIKRLGYAATQNSVQAVQCLCLAGIWYMHRMEPLEAWKYFNLAGAAWHSLSLTEFPFGGLTYNSDGPSNELTVLQALYFTIWKSESELRIELPLPGPPVLDNAYFPLTFPQPPSLTSHSPNPELVERERGWYYYLAEIAARHLINRILQMNSEVPDTPTERHVRRMIAQAEMMESQIHDWYSLLPQMFYFEIPDGYVADFHPDAMIFVLRHRYFTLRELVARPFVRLCVDLLVEEMHPSVCDRVGLFASQCVRFCMLKLSQTVAHRHQGTWYMLRITTAASLILAAVHRAQCETQQHQPRIRTTVQSVVLPEDWRSMIHQALDSAQTYFEEPNGGASNLAQIIRAVLTTDHNHPSLSWLWSSLL